MRAMSQFFIIDINYSLKINNQLRLHNQINISPKEFLSFTTNKLVLTELHKCVPVHVCVKPAKIAILRLHIKCDRTISSN